MASRRNRIKGIANIPQRRKTAPQNSLEDDELKVIPTEQPEENNVERNLNVVEAVQENSTLTDNETQNQSESKNQDVNQPERVETIATLSETLCSVGNQKNENTIKPPPESQEVPEKPKDAPVVRRKFIKPTIAVNSVARKAKEKVDVVKEVEGKQSKIVILSETLIVPGQGDSSEAKIITTGPTDNGIRRLPQPPPTPELEYPLPPPSPNKINRSRIKAIPRFSQRNTSYSASESEDESKRNRNRNDSVCSTTSTTVDSILECPASPQKVPKEFNSAIQRKCRRTEQSRKLAEARRDFYYKFGNNKPDRQKLTMMDLIFYNPTTNLMSQEGKKLPVEENSEEIANEEAEVDKPDTPPESDEENAVPAPQIKVGPSGELIVDEQSLVIENAAVKKSREQIESSKIINGNFESGYGVYKRKKRAKDWTKQETLKFYKALNTIGTDFTMMCELFPRRTRRELKLKFKKEERINKTLIDKALMQPCSFDFNEFKMEVELEEKNLEELEKLKDNKQGQKYKKRKVVVFSSTNDNPLYSRRRSRTAEKPTKKKKDKYNLDIMDLVEDESLDEADESDVRSSDEDDEVPMIQSLQRPTRSGRVPKLLNRYQPPIYGHPAHVIASKPKAGALTGMVSQGDDGETVLKVFMVTPEHGKQTSFGDGVISNLTKSLERNIFTISVSKGPNVAAVEENVGDEGEIEENNFTISHSSPPLNGDAVVCEGNGLAS